MGYLLLALVLLLVFIVVLPTVVRALSLLSRRRREAERRAQSMLVEMLTAEEYEQMRQNGYLRVQSPAYQNRVYHVPEHSGMVAVFEDGSLKERLCVGAAGFIPEGDTVMLHKLMIEGDEDEYLRVANHFPPRPYSFQM
ncbi:MAG: hypothetical protein M1401_11355 [Chloroflexi bacterium]|nr:hypothetical protein [Chloroflexota bacterium]